MKKWQKAAKVPLKNWQKDGKIALEIIGFMENEARLKRKITATLAQWKADPDRVPLVIKGLRQVGKTSSVKAFAKSNYENAFFLDFRKDHSLHAIFDGDFSMESFSMFISALPEENRLIEHSEMIPYKTVLIFDEIQDCPNARSSLKYFKVDGRFDVICTGSLLGVDGYRISKKPSRGIPVGSEETIEMTSLDFEEFLWACGIREEVISSLKQCADEGRPIPSFLHERCLQLLRSYMVVGGMPECVCSYLDYHDVAKVRKIQHRILNNYRADFGVHMDDSGMLFIDESEKARLLQVFDSIPYQLAKDNSKFQFSRLGLGARGRTHSGALAWLQGYGLIVTSRNLSCMEQPLEMFAQNDNFKVFVSDVGLLTAMLEDGDAFKILSNELTLSKGYLFENLVADALHKLGKRAYFYAKSSGLKIDFVSVIKGNPCLIEAKAKEGRTKSARTILSDPGYHVDHLLKLTAQNIGVVGNVVTSPYYLAFYLLGQ